MGQGDISWAAFLATGIVLCSGDGFQGQNLSFPKIISGRIGDVAQPRSEWRQWRQIVGLLGARAHLSVMPSACALDCNTLDEAIENTFPLPIQFLPSRPCRLLGLEISTTAVASDRSAAEQHVRSESRLCENVHETRMRRIVFSIVNIGTTVAIMRIIDLIP
jgi:hypothetical protein